MQELLWNRYRRAESSSRKLLIGSSDAPTIMGLSPWQTPMGLWLQKQDDEPSVDSNALERGRYLEPAIVQWTAARVKALQVVAGIPIGEAGIEGPEPWMAFHPDGALLIGTGEGADFNMQWRLLETKSARRNEGWGDDGNDDLPLHYLAQVQFQLACLPDVQEAQVGAFLMAADALRTYVVQRDDDFIAYLIDVLGEWHLRCIVEGKAPALDGSKAAAAFLTRQHSRAFKTMRDATPHEVALVREFAQVKATIKAAEAREGELANLLRAACGDNEGLQVEGVGKVTWRHVSGAERIDANLLRADFPDAASACTVRGDDRRDLRFWPAKGGK